MSLPGDPRHHLLTNGTADRYRRELAGGVARVAARVAGTTQPFTGVTPEKLALEFAGVDLDRPLGDSAAVLDELEDLYLRDAVYFHHPRYLAHLNCPVVIPALVGEAVLTAINSSLDTWDQSAGGTLIERRLIDWTAERIGLGPFADGVFTSGGTQSNLHALLLAREEARAEQARPGRLRILASAAGHFSVQKSAKLLGLDPDAVIGVATGPDRRMSPDALAAALVGCRERGDTVMAVVATAGTTDFGTIDPLPEIADLCTTFRVWLHVDAAYGCGLLVSPTRRHLLAGIERASSVTVDYHKSFFQPVSSSALLVRDGRTLRHATYHADYLNPARMAEQRIPNQVDKSLQTTRRFDALKLWLTLRVMGPDLVGSYVDAVCDLATATHDALRGDPEIELAAEPSLSTLVLRYRPAGVTEDAADVLVPRIRQTLYQRGSAMVAATKVEGRCWLKLTLLNPLATREDVLAVVGQVRGVGRELTEVAA